MIKKGLQILVLLIGATVILMLLRPVSVDRESAAAIEGVVINVDENEYKDIVITLKNVGGSFYINRGLENQFKPGELQKMLNGQHVAILYADQWGRSQNTARHILQLSANGEELYSEFNTVQ